MKTMNKKGGIFGFIGLIVVVVVVLLLFNVI